MTDLVYTLGSGTLLILVLFFVFTRLFRVTGKTAALFLTMAVVGIYVPIAVVTEQSLDVIAIHLAIYVITLYVLGLTTAPDRRGLEDEGENRPFIWGPLAIIGFFMVVISVDVVFITLAETGLDRRFSEIILPEPASEGSVSSIFPGVVAGDYQKKEALYNEYLEKRRIQDALGWQVKKGWLSDPYHGKPAVFQVELRDRDGKPLNGASGAGQFQRPSDMRDDVFFDMKGVGNGLYQAEVVLPQPGRWSLLLNMKHEDDDYEIRATTQIERSR